MKCRLKNGEHLETGQDSTWPVSKKHYFKPQVWPAFKSKLCSNVNSNGSFKNAHSCIISFVYFLRPQEPDEGVIIAEVRPASQSVQQPQRAMVAPQGEQQQQQLVVFTARRPPSGKPAAARLQELMGPQPGPSGIRRGPSPAQLSNANVAGMNRKRPRDPEVESREFRGYVRHLVGQEVIKMIKAQKSKMRISVTFDLEGSESETVQLE